MNRTKLFLVAIGIAFVLATVIFLENPVTVGAVSCFPVKILDKDKIEPLNLSVNTGDCVVWVNFCFSTPGPGKTYKMPVNDVLVTFPKATCEVDEITTTSTGFKKNVATECFVAGWLRPGETASLVFKNPGTYKYDIQFRVGKELGGKAEGTVIVK